MLLIRGGVQMTFEEVVSFVECSADMAVDYYGSKDFPDSVASFRENIRDTLNDHGLERYEAEMFELYESIIAKELGK